MKAIIYARVSSTNDRQNTERQISDLTQYAEANGLELVKVFSEHISGAKRNEERSTLVEALTFAKDNGIDVVLFSELSRLGRDVMEVQEVVKYLRDNHINAYFHKEGLSILDKKGRVSPMTSVLIACLGMVAEIERENIKYRLNSGRELAKSKGVKMGRKAGSTESLNDKAKKYPIAMRLLRNSYRLTDILAICRDKGENISLSTLKRLKKLV